MKFRIVPRGKGAWLRLLLFPLGLYVALCAGMYVYQTRLIYRTAFEGYPAWEPESELTKTITITGHDGEIIHARLFLPTLKATTARRPVAMAFHGNWDGADSYGASVEVLSLLSRGFIVLAPEYRGYPPNGGAPSQAVIQRDMVTFHDAFVQRSDVDPSRLVYVGRSLGSGVACDLARVRPPKAMILLAPFTSIASFAWGYGVPPFLVRDRYASDEVLRALDAPVLIAHGTRDSVIPIAHGRALAGLAKRATIIEDASEHNDLPMDAHEFGRAVDAFLVEAGILTAEAVAPAR